MHDDDNNNVVELRRGTQREWAAARIVLIGGFVIAIAIAGWFGWKAQQAAEVANTPAAEVQAPPKPLPRDVKTAMMLFCAQELVESKNVNIVPVDAQLAEQLPRKTNVKNRFACIAQTTATVYFITADYLCPRVNDNKCVRLYDIQTREGLLIYRRRRTETTPDDRRFRRTVKQILRVNHAGEYGAIRIYQAQIAMAHWRAPALLPFLRETLGHERTHLAAFRELMWPRGTRPCGAMPLWAWAGSRLASSPDCSGRNAILICTEAVERTVHAHLDKQLAWLGTRDPVLSETIATIREQEQGHLENAQAGQSTRSTFGNALDKFVSAVTTLLIWSSTYGALSRMQGNLAR